MRPFPIVPCKKCVTKTYVIPISLPLCISKKRSLLLLFPQGFPVSRKRVISEKIFRFSEFVNSKRYLQRWFIITVILHTVPVGVNTVTAAGFNFGV